MNKLAIAREFIENVDVKGENDKEAIRVISLLLEKEENTPIEKRREYLINIVDKLLAGILTIRGEEISTNFYHIKVFDSLERELVANLAFEKILGQYHLKHFEFLQGEFCEQLYK